MTMGLRQGVRGASLLHSDDGNFFGVCLGWDFTAEHEWDIDILRKSIGSHGRSELDIDRFRVRLIPKGMVFIDEKNFTTWGLFNRDNRFEYGHRELCISVLRKETFAGAWSDSFFGCASIDDGQRKCIRDLANHFNRLDCAIFRHRFNDEITGLSVLIPSLTPKSITEEVSMLLREAKVMDDLHKETIEKSELHEKLKSSGKSWHTLSPRFKPEDFSRDTKYDIIFWLNPWEQHKYDCGFFTVEELLDWANNCGPVVKKSK